MRRRSWKRCGRHRWGRVVRWDDNLEGGANCVGQYATNQKYQNFQLTGPPSLTPRLGESSLLNAGRLFRFTNPSPSSSSLTTLSNSLLSSAI